MKGKPLFGLIFGAGIGSGVTWYLLKRKYDKQIKKYSSRIEEEVASVREMYEKKFGIVPEKPEHSEFNIQVAYPDFKDIAQKIITERATPPNNIKGTEKPYVISPDDFNEMEESGDYHVIRLNYYADGALTDDENDILTDVEIKESVGTECLGHFGDYEEDVVHVCNDKKSCIYEITRDENNYTDII